MKIRYTFHPQIGIFLNNRGNILSQKTERLSHGLHRDKLVALMLNSVTRDQLHSTDINELKTFPTPFVGLPRNAYGRPSEPLNIDNACHIGHYKTIYCLPPFGLVPEDDYPKDISSFMRKGGGIRSVSSKSSNPIAMVNGKRISRASAIVAQYYELPQDYPLFAFKMPDTTDHSIENLFFIWKAGVYQPPRFKFTPQRLESVKPYLPTQRQQEYHEYLLHKYTSFDIITKTAI